MNKALAKVLRDKLLTLPFVDVAAGLVQTVTTTDTVPTNETGGESTITKKFPVATSVVPAHLCEGKEFRCIPNSKNRSILYFEEFGLTVGPKVHSQTTYVSQLRLVVWLNRKNLVGDAYTDISGRCMAAIVDRLAGQNPENVDIFTRLTIEVSKVLPQDSGVFARYTYNETDRQYLRPPFEFFAIDFTCKFQVRADCMESINWNIAVC